MRIELSFCLFLELTSSQALLLFSHHLTLLSHDWTFQLPLLLSHPDSPIFSTDWNNMLKHHTAHPLLPFDSGTTSHCSPYHEDFAHLTSIPMREIKGINGSSISTIAIGTIYIKCGKGQRLFIVIFLYLYLV